MGAATRSILQGLRIGEQLGRPIGEALGAMRQRSNQLEDKDRDLHNELLLKAALNPESGLVATPSAFDKEAGMRVGLPQALTQDQQQALEAGGPSPVNPNIKPIGIPGFAIDTQAKQAASNQVYEDLKRKLLLENQIKNSRPFTLSPGESVGMYDQNGSFRSDYTAPSIPRPPKLLTDEEEAQQIRIRNAGRSFPLPQPEKISVHDNESLRSLRSQRSALTQMLGTTFDDNARLKIQRRLQDLQNAENQIIQRLPGSDQPLPEVAPTPSVQEFKTMEEAEAFSATAPKGTKIRVGNQTFEVD